MNRLEFRGKVQEIQTDKKTNKLVFKLIRNGIAFLCVSSTNLIKIKENEIIELINYLPSPTGQLNIYEILNNSDEIKERILLEYGKSINLKQVEQELINTINKTDLEELLENQKKNVENILKNTDLDKIGEPKQQSLILNFTIAEKEILKKILIELKNKNIQYTLTNIENNKKSLKFDTSDIEYWKSIHNKIKNNV